MTPGTLPKKLGRYEIGEMVGEGAMGRVFRGFDPLVRRNVAIKTLRSDRMTAETSADYLRRFRREAQAAGGLSHPYILSVFDVGEDYFVMEYLEGTTLSDLLSKRGRLPVQEALAMLEHVADALDYLHRNGIVHRDIKPANIMVLNDGRPKLMDFGVAHLESSVMTAAGEVFGSPSYMAPEQIAGGEITLRSDLFSFAVVAYEVVTGRKPFHADTLTTVIYKVVNEEPPPPRQIQLDLPPQYDDVFRKALAKNPAERYESARQFVLALELKELDSTLAELKEVSPPESQPVEARPKPASPFPKPGQPRPRWILRAAMLLVLAVLGAGIWFSKAPSAPRVSRLNVEATPVGAAVFLDGQEVGKTPLSLNAVDTGRHTVKLTKAGFAPAELTLDIIPDAKMPPLVFSLQPLTGRVTVTSDPPEATVQVDGKDAGQTPLNALQLDGGRHTVLVERVGFTSWSRDVDLRAGEDVSFEARLEAQAAARPEKGKTRATPPPKPAPLKAGDLVALGPGVDPPRKLTGDWAPYPKTAARAHMVGTVTVEMIVSEEGLPTDVRVVQSAGALLDAAVLEAVGHWRFAPAEKDGVKVRVRWSVVQRFERRS